MALTTNAYANNAISNATASNVLGAVAKGISALGKAAETLYAAILTNSATLSADAPPTEANLQSRIAAPNKTIRPDGI